MQISQEENGEEDREGEKPTKKKKKIAIADP